MAFTVARTQALANVRSVYLTVTADAAEANLTSGLAKIFGMSVSYGSTTSGQGHFYMNKNSSGTAAAGIIGVSGVTSGDDIYITVHGV